MFFHFNIAVAAFVLTATNLKTCDEDHMVPKGKSTFCLVLDKESLLAPGFEHTNASRLMISVLSSLRSHCHFV